MILIYAAQASWNLPWLSTTTTAVASERGVVAQASFDPPGLTVAVKRDRAAEALLLTGARFVVNIMAEGAEKVCMYCLLRLPC